MSRKKPLLSDLLEELKELRHGVCLNKLITIFYDDRSLNPNDKDGYSERVPIKTAMLSKLNPKDYQSYRVVWYYQLIFNPNAIEIYVKKIKENKDEQSYTKAS